MRSVDIIREISPLGPKAVLLRYRSKRGHDEPDSVSRIVDEINMEELFDLLDLKPAEREPFREKARIFWFANGFQSWSPGWELQGRQRHHSVRFLKILERFTLRDGLRPHGKELVGHGFAYVRADESYLALASLNPRTPPAAFRLDRANLRLTVELHSRGAVFAQGETLAETAVFMRVGYWEFADFIAALYRDRSCSARADFLKGPRDRFLTAGGWESWYDRYTNIDEGIITNALEGLSGSPNVIREYFIGRGRPVVFQIDDGWQRAVGDWQANITRFPSGMKALAERISAKGYIPGLWLAPFLICRKARLFTEKPEWLLRSRDGIPVRAGWNPGWEGDFFCLDLSNPKVREYLNRLFDAIVNDWGFRYLKLDFLYAGMLNGAHANQGPAYRWYRDALEPIVAAARTGSGYPVAFLGCGAPLESSVDLFPLMRIGADTRETWDHVLARLLGHEGRPSAYVNLKDTLGRAFMNRSMYHSDPDVVFLRSYSCDLTDGEKTLIAAAAIMFGSQIMISDDPGRFGSPGESGLTQRVLRLYSALEDREYGAVMLRRDVWRCFSRDESIRGIANLRGNAIVIPKADAVKWRLSGEPLTEGARSEKDGVRVDAHRIALWR
jgi:alpha-galactosidase